MSTIPRLLPVVLTTLLAAACAAETITEPEPEPPTANAGPDQRIVDRDGNGWEFVALRRGSCSPGSHAITAYRWLEDGEDLTGIRMDDWTFVAELAVGRHIIWLKVVNAARLSAMDSVVVEVLPGDPEVSPTPSIQIKSPRGGAVFATGTEIQLIGWGTDESGERLAEEQLSWSSDVDGPIGTGETLRVASLSRGRHLITLTGTDGRGLVLTASVAITIADPPIAMILSPANGSSCAVFDEMRLEGRCVGQDGYPVTGRSVYWEPDMWMGRERKYEMSVDVVCLGPGLQTISLVCTDENGLTSRAQIGVDYFISYDFNIRPVLADFGCVDCHGPLAQEGNIRLDAYSALVDGGNGRGPLIVPGDPSGGFLIPKLLSGHHFPEGRVLTTPFYWGWVDPRIGVVRWWVDHFLEPWIEGGAIDN